MSRPDPSRVGAAGPAGALKALADPDEVARRQRLLAGPHLDPLRPYLAELRARHSEVPWPDPADGGAAARLLILLETPGPGIRRTGFVSRDNPSGTSANLSRFLREAAIPRRETLIWNLVPWVIHLQGASNRAPNRREIAAGLDEVPPLLACLDRLEAVVLAGRVAAFAEPHLQAFRPAVPVLRMPHPSPTYLCTSPAHPARVRAVLAEAAACLASPARQAA